MSCVVVISRTAPGDDWPLSPRILHRIHVNRFALEELLECRSGLVERLLADDVITRQQRSYLTESLSDVKTNEKLLDIISRRSLAHYKTFIRCLQETNQQQLARILIIGGG